MREIELPKPDKRYRPGTITKDNKGAYRGHPDTVELKRMSVPLGAPLDIQLNPPLIATKELAEFLKPNNRGQRGRNR